MERLAAGIYVEPDGTMHAFPVEFCADKGWPITEENVAKARRIMVTAIRGVFPEVVVADAEEA